MPEKSWDVVILGAGPSGLMAAIPCAEAGLRTLVIDSKKTIGAKLLVSGGGRCNVTHLKVSEKDYQSGEPRTVRNILRAYPPTKILEFFQEFDVEMVLEEGAKYFPKEQSSKVVLQALLEASRRAGVIFAKGKKVERVSRSRDFFRITGEGFEYFSGTLVVATGGLSYPWTGSDGSGYSVARSLGHAIVPTTPALTPLTTDDPDWKALSGITLPVEVSIVSDGKKLGRSEGALLFTHIGFSGPAVLDISGPWLRCKAERKELIVNFLPHRREAEVAEALSDLVGAHAGRSWTRALSQYFPERLGDVLLRKKGIDPRSRLDQISKKDRGALVRSFFYSPVQVTGSLGYEKAEVTAGGVDLKEVDAKTLESKMCPRLFFAGEVLDVDGAIGGFNFQWAWASGSVVGKAIARSFRGCQA